MQLVYCMLGLWGYRTFLYPSTSAHTLAVAAQLRTFNFNAADLNRELDQMPLKVAKLAGYIYQNLEIDANGAARVVLPQSILNSYDIVDSETAAIVSMPGKIEDVLSWAIFVEQPEGYYRVRLRSKGPIINTIAKNIMAAAILWQVALMHVMRLKLK